MNAVADPDRTPNEGTSGVLGDLLHASGAKPAPPEAGWLALLGAIRDGDQRALQALYQRTHRIVFTLIMRILRDQRSAEEVTLDVFHDVWRRAAKYEASGGPVLGWILNQARSRAIDRVRFEHRSKRSDPFANQGEVADDTDACAEAIDCEQRGQLLRNALAALLPAERASIESAFFGELTYVEVASELNEPEGTVKTRIRSGLQKLRIALGDGVTRR